VKPVALLGELRRSESLLPNLQELHLLQFIWTAELQDVTLDLLEHRLESSSLSTISLLEILFEDSTENLMLDEAGRVRRSALRESNVNIKLSQW